MKTHRSKELYRYIRLLPLKWTPVAKWYLCIRVRVAVTNDTQRDAFRRHFSADERKELASVEADIKAIEVSQFKAREDLNAKKEALSCIRAKAQLQAAALTYLA